MAFIQCLTDSFRVDLLNAVHNFGSDTINIALYGPSANLDNTTTAYTATGEISSSGYSAGGSALTGQTVNGATGVSWVFWNNPTWTLNPTTQVQGCLLYNTTRSNKSILILNFGTVQLPNPAGIFTVKFPPTPANSSNIGNSPMVNAVLILG